jgi:hypothetical protein
MWAVIRHGSPVFIPLTVITLMSIGASVALHPALVRALANQSDAVVHGAKFSIWLAGALAPLYALLKAGVLAAVGWAIATLTMREISFRTLFSLLLIAQIIIVLRDAYSVAIIYLGGLDTIRSPSDVLVPAGFDLFIHGLGPVRQAVAQTTGLFDFLWAGFLVLGLQTTLGVGRLDAVIGAAALWGTRVAFAVVRALFLA